MQHLFKGSAYSNKNSISNPVISLLVQLIFFLCLLQRQQRLSPERRQVLLERSAKELTELFSVYAGKLLGTAAWRRMIGKPESRVKFFQFIHSLSLSLSENIHTSPMEGFLVEPSLPLEFPTKLHTSPYKFWLFRPPSPSEFPMTFFLGWVWIFSGTTHCHYHYNNSHGQPSVLYSVSTRAGAPLEN